jgi:hypothetical protein
MLQMMIQPMHASTLVSIVLAADTTDEEDLFLRAAIVGLLLLGVDERISTEQHADEDRLAASTSRPGTEICCYG